MPIGAAATHSVTVAGVDERRAPRPRMPLWRNFGSSTDAFVFFPPIFGYVCSRPPVLLVAMEHHQFTALESAATVTTIYILHFGRRKEVNAIRRMSAVQIPTVAANEGVRDSAP